MSQRRKIHADASSVTIMIPGVMLTAIAAVQDEEFCNRANAIRIVLERGLQASQPSRPARSRPERAQ